MALSRRSLLAGVAALPILATGCVKTRRPDSPKSALFFERTRRRSARKVFPHYFGQLPRSLDNSPTPDYYDREYLRVAGESGEHAAWRVSSGSTVASHTYRGRLRVRGCHLGHPNGPGDGRGRFLRQYHRSRGIDLEPISEASRRGRSF